MNKPTVTTADVIQMTINSVRSFYSRQPDIDTLPLTEDFMWIGSNDLQWCETSTEFTHVAKPDSDEPPILLSDEEFHLLFHDHNVWVVYGRYKITTTLEDGAIIHAHVRGTYVWRRINGEMKLAHVHRSHAQDITLNQQLLHTDIFAPRADYADHMKRFEALTANTHKIAFSSRERKHRYVFPEEILYIKADGAYSIVYTTLEHFQVIGLLAEHEANLPASFQRIHKSYLVNTFYIDSICRYKAVLQNGQELPIGKEKYMDLKRTLQNQYNG